MSLNNHGLPSRVPVIAEMGRMLADSQVPEADKQLALELLVQDHADLDEVEVQSALWAIGQMGTSAAACDALLACAPAWLAHADAAPLFLDAYSAVGGSPLRPVAAAAFAQLQVWAGTDAELAARLQRTARP